MLLASILFVSSLVFWVICVSLFRIWRPTMVMFHAFRQIMGWPRFMFLNVMWAAIMFLGFYLLPITMSVATGLFIIAMCIVYRRREVLYMKFCEMELDHGLALLRIRQMQLNELKDSDQ